MSQILVADIGGTKTLFQLSSDNTVIFEKEFASQQFASFDLVLSALLSEAGVEGSEIDSACFAVAGPVSGREADVTNLPWQLNADELESKFGLNAVILCNDFAAVAHGIACLSDDDCMTLQQGEVITAAPRAVIGAGTGLGQALMFKTNELWQVIATEGGHTDFAPLDSKQVLLLERLMERFGHVSYERVLSGAGLVTIYEFLRSYEQRKESAELRQAMINSDPASAISQYAQQHNDALAIESLQLFLRIYGAQAGNLALTVSPRGGLYIAGGIAAKNLALFQKGEFIDAFLAKGRMRGLLEQIPVHIILQPKVGLLGAKVLAQQSTV